MPARLAALALAAMLSACAGAPGEQGGSIAQAVEPSLRAAAANAEANHDYKGAAQHWGTLYQRRPDDRDVAINLARSLRAGGQPQQAADLMQAQLLRQPNDPLLLMELGKDYLAADRIGLAVKALEQASSLAPTAWEAHSALGVAQDTLGRPAAAAASYGRALELSPGNAAVLNNLGLSLALAGHLDEGIATLRRALELPAAGTQVSQNLAMLLALKGDAAQAERLARRDLPPDMARNNADILKAVAASAKGE
jgi:Flp pilus assembly protein TadD